MTDTRSRGSIAAASAPRSENPAATPIAGPKPSTNPCAEAKLPAPANTAAAIAIPNTPPSSRIMLFVPAALPIASSGTAPTTEFWPDGIAICHAGLGDQGDPRHADRLQREAGDHERPLADPVRERPRDRRDRQERRRP